MVPGFQPERTGPSKLTRESSRETVFLIGSPVPPSGAGKTASRYNGRGAFDKTARMKFAWAVPFFRHM